jgi:phenylacetate-CoA ligase
MRRIAKITGRSDDMIILRGVNLFPSQIEEIVLGIPALSSHFVLELTRPARLDELTIRIEPREGASDSEVTAARAELIGSVKTLIGSTVEVAMAPTGSLARSTGKLQRLYDLRG